MAHTPVVIHPLEEATDVEIEFYQQLSVLPKREFEKESGEAYKLLKEFFDRYGRLQDFADFVIIHASEKEANIRAVLQNLHLVETIYSFEKHPRHMYSNLPDYTEDRIDTAKRIAGVIMSFAAENDPKPKALPIMCGTGKSSSLSYIIRDVIQRNDGNGLIIVTDSVERMHSYVEKGSGGDEQLKIFLDDNRDKITILESGHTYETAWKNKEKTPVLILTTQRYFNELDGETLLKLFDWDGGHRNLIIFDEIPYMQNFVEVTNGSNNKVLSALQTGLSDAIDPKERNWCLEQWRLFSAKIESQLNVYYHIYSEQKKSYFIYKHPTGHITEDDDRFWSIILQSRSTIDSKNFRAIQYLMAVNRLVTSPTLVYCTNRNSVRIQKFIVRIGKMNRINSVPAKAIILDGTADVSPEYDKNMIDTVQCEDFERDLSNLEVKLVNIKATKDALIRYEWLTEAIERYVAKEMKYMRRPTVFTYKDVEDNFRNNFITAHFGDIKGRNIYRDANMITQVGINRYDETYYVALGLYTNGPLYDEIAEITDPAQQANTIGQLLDDTHHFRDIMIRSMVADIEQNLFRGCIRDPFNETLYTYLILYDFDSKDVSGLKETIQSRYKKLNATILPLPEPDEIKEIRETPWASEKIYQKQLVLDWLERAKRETPDRVFTINEMLSEILIPSENEETEPQSMTQAQFQKIKENDSRILHLFRQMRIGNTRKYAIAR